MGSHQKSSSSKGHGSSSHGKSSSSKSKSGSKRAPIYVNVWYCDACHYGPLNPYTDGHCANCGHQRCYDCTTTVIEQNPGQ
ncbi:hypothetical protein CH63R_09987 [Colletotrichum higginsianum IMI 349063]|uniref:Uncharacterized protein n=2 Tax=Colletotrichum higginsianum TaxID=80884 RepID=A0A1B7Y1M0_COLHI|nr:uncharacterized protein CH63R_09987 [Colletotrichum higginsianum IMI 349063]OBR05867.1 hypothetical protein CH63R_09987 [Colletotrichum higginsianum IMI 349063]TIC90762.1 hypothetical protein CH35J_011674 [Colletotrichum higginsianum]GJD03855.1 hypothetical protein ColKHC_12680 [Colletotrichum higginsianum]